MSDSQMHKKNRIKGAKLSLLIRLLNLSLSFLLSYLLAKNLGVNGFGAFSYAITWSSLLSIPSTLGFDKLLVREISVNSAKEDWKKIKNLTYFSTILTIASSFTIAFITGIVIFFLKPINDAIMLSAFFLGLASVPIIALKNIRLSVTKGFNKVILGLIPEMLVSPLIFVISLLLVSILAPKYLTPIIAVGLFILANFLSFILGAIIQYRVTPKKVHLARLNLNLSSFKWLTRSLPFMFVEAIRLIQVRTDIVMLGIFSTSTEVGLYSISARLASLVALSLMSVNSVLSPKIAKLNVENKTSEMQAVVSENTRFILFISLSISAIIVIFSGFILNVFGNGFSEAGSALKILVLGRLIDAFFGPVGLILAMTNNEKDIAVSGVISTALNVILNFMLIQKYGAVGAALATFSSIMLVNILNFRAVVKKLNINTTIIPLTF
ncbi:flippase [Leptothoe kymatousa]|uniref:Flippase n=1 Tax=Leptothoe kymatousa TAU-MAC 1615 TaxID=2364775 RepID=A0ABS5Y3R3_9CYAN|nr:flippase [Leptothoe kymatousa]MBT9312470.1 flippase [Leptothoe kymatousa TAU-MAC 1615]